MRRNVFICLLLAGITLALYWPAGSYDVVFYDDTSFTDNPEVQSGLNGQSFLWAMTGVVAANWHPVTSLSFVLAHQFFGTNAGAEHLVNVFFHAANAALLFLVLWQLTRATWRSALVAALFAWHPLRVESVAWIAERKDVLCGFFVLLTLWCYARFAGGDKVHPPAPSSGATRSSKSKNFYGTSLFFFALALMSKAMAVTLPFLLLLLDVWPLGRIQNSKFKIQKLKPLLVEKIPFFALTAVFCAVTFLVQQHSEATPSLSELGLGIRLENVIVSYLRYLGWSVWPANLAMFYSFPFDSHFYLALWPGWEIAAGALALAGISVLCVKQLFQRPYLAVGWFWYLGTMVPVIGFVQVGSQGMADRYTYIPLIGPVISLVWLMSEQWGAAIFRRAMIIVPTAAVLIASILQTRHQLQFWKNTETLTKHTIEVTGENPRAEYIAGLGLEHAGRIAEAMVHYRNAMTSQPTVKEAYYAMGRLLGQQGNWTLAEQAYLLMLENNPNDFNAHLGLVNVLPHLGRMAEAETHLKAALQNCPDEPEALNNLAWTLATSNDAGLRDGAQAVKCAERACQLTGYRETIVVGTLGAAYAEAGRFDDAIATAQKACDLAEKSGEKNLLQKNQELLELYRQHQTYHEAGENSSSESDQSRTNQPVNDLGK